MSKEENRLPCSSVFICVHLWPFLPSPRGPHSSSCCAPPRAGRPAQLAPAQHRGRPGPPGGQLAAEEPGPRAPRCRRRARAACLARAAASLSVGRSPLTRPRVMLRRVLPPLAAVTTQGQQRRAPGRRAGPHNSWVPVVHGRPRRCAGPARVWGSHPTDCTVKAKGTRARRSTRSRPGKQVPATSLSITSPRTGA